MASVVEWYPGPSSTEEYSTLASLKSAIQTHVLSQMTDGGIRSGLTSSPPYLLDAGSHAAGSMPYFSYRFEDVETSDYVDKRLRYSSALVGMLDPFSWFPDIYAVSGLSWQDWNLNRTSGKGGYDLPSVIASPVNASGLCRSSITTSHFDRVVYSWGPRAGGTAGVELTQRYTPNAAEQEDGITASRWSAYILGDDADDGTLGVTGAPSGFGENYSQVPHVIVEGSDAASEWSDVKGDFGGIKDGIQNGITPSIQDLRDRVSKLGPLAQRDTVTHPDDVGEPGDSAYVPGAEPLTPTFTSAAALPAIVTAPTTLLALSSIPAIVTAAMGMLGTAAATVLNLGWLQSSLDALGKLVDISTSADNVATEVQSAATEAGRSADALERIADSLEAIQAEVVRDLDATPPRAGLVNAVELASQTSTEITMKAKGFEMEASTGSVVEG